MKTFLLGFILLLSAGRTLLAFSVDDTKIANKDYFGIQFPNNTTFMAKHAAILSVSEQIYWLNGFIIKEIIIDFSGADSLLRIYNMRHPDAQDLINQAQASTPKSDTQRVSGVFESARNRTEKLERKLAEKTDASRVVEGANSVTKIYPATTHSKTVEYAIGNENELDSFHARIVEDLTKYKFEKKDGLDINPKIGGRLYIFKSDKDQSVSK